MRRAGLLDRLDQQPGSDRADLTHRLSDRSQRRFAIFGHRDIVVTDNRYVFRHPPSTSLLVGIGLAQIGEFSFVLVQVARNAGHVSDDIYSAILAASLLSILLNALLVRVGPGWLGRRRR